MIEPPNRTIKVKQRVTHTLHLLFKSGKNRTYHVYPDNVATLEKYWKWGRHINGIIYLQNNNVTWTFKHAKGVACIKTDTLAEINVEIGQVDPTNNPLARTDHYDDPLN